MSHFREVSGVNFNSGHAPPRPPKSKSIILEDDQPTYLTTVPKSPSQPPIKQPKGILKNNINQRDVSFIPLWSSTDRIVCNSSPDRIPDIIQNKNQERIPHNDSYGFSQFERNPLIIDNDFERANPRTHERASLRTYEKASPRTHESSRPRTHEMVIEEQKQLLSDAGSENIDFKEHKKQSLPSSEINSSKYFKNYSHEKKNVKKGKKEQNNSQEKKEKRIKAFKYNKDSYSKAIRAAGIESAVGILHLIVIVTSIITIIMMSKLTDDWELKRRRCPMYVKNTPNVGIYWGNEKLTACHYAAYMPVLILIMSVALILFHGGILYSWRNGGDTSKILLTKAYPRVMFSIELLEMIIALSVAGVIADGFRQTCLSFQLNPWPEERPKNCKGGYHERDDVYGISKTYSRLVTSIVTSTISMMMLILTSLLYLLRMKLCRRKKYVSQK